MSARAFPPRLGAPGAQEEQLGSAVTMDHGVAAFVARPRARGLLRARSVLALSDAAALAVAALAVAFGAAWVHGGGTSGSGALAFAGLFWGTTLVCFQLTKVRAAAARQVVPASTGGLGRALVAVVAATLALVDLAVIARGSFGGVMTPPQVLLAGLVAGFMIPLARLVALVVSERWGRSRVRVAVVGTGVIALDVAARVRRARLAEFVGFVDDDPVSPMGVLGPIDALGALCARHRVDQVVVAFSRAHPAKVARKLRQLDQRVAVTVVPRYFDITGWQATLGDLGGLPTVSMGHPPGVVARAAKRSIDLAVAAVALVLLSPLMALAVVAVKLSSPGPALFRQVRLGRQRHPFSIIKLRTMRQSHTAPAPSGEAAWGAGLATTSGGRSGGDEETRVTPLGRVLRRSGIDELPQLVNVVRGQMSLVGPRPFVPQECEGLPPWAEARFEVRPGLTGLWQVCGQHALRPEELHRLDAQYARRWTLGGDLRILALTPQRLLRGGGDRHRFRRQVVVSPQGEQPAS